MNSDKGASFTSPIQLSNGLSAASPKLIASGKFVYIVWYDYDTNNSNTDIFFTRITIDDGNVPIVNEPVNLSDSAAASDYPQIYLNGKDIFVVWQELIEFNYDAFFQAPQNYLVYKYVFK